VFRRELATEAGGKAGQGFFFLKANDDSPPGGNEGDVFRFQVALHVVRLIGRQDRLKLVHGEERQVLA